MTEDTTVRDALRQRITANLRAAREKSGLSQPAVAERMRADGFPYSQQTLTRIEAGTRKADFAEMVALADIYQVSLGDLGRPEGLARKSWQITRAIRAARDTHREIRQLQLKLDAARANLERMIALAEDEGSAKDLAAELEIAHRALEDTEAGK